MNETVYSLLVGLTTILTIVSVSLIMTSSSSNPSTDQLKVYLATLTTVNLLVMIFLGYLVYDYILKSPSSLIPITLLMITFNLFISILSFSIALQQKVF